MANMGAPVLVDNHIGLWGLQEFRLFGIKWVQDLRPQGSIGCLGG